MGIRELAEGIILQSMEDLADPTLSEDCVAFFRGRDFASCAEMAGINETDQAKLLSMIKHLLIKSEAAHYRGHQDALRRHEKKKQKRQEVTIHSF